MANEITTTKRKIKEMILKDSEITKILLNGKENNYANVKGLLNKNVFNYIRNDCTTDSGIRVLYEANYVSYRGEMIVSVSIVIEPTCGCNVNDEEYNNYIDILSERILEDVISTFSVEEYNNVVEQTEYCSMRRKITFIISE